ncbi:metallophosphoesterase [Segetibacter koreensis]|uniref:metallophosphoesterase n=1 Tax=Segetibacter koreensis TaxID=398037 RepID=UPI000361ADC3|nr:metallophosphoesterase [Segetibacter koreensis]
MNFKKESFIYKFYLFIIIFLITAMYACRSAHIAGTAKPFYFFQMSDPQFGMFTDNHGFAKETINAEKAIEAANRLHPAFVIVCGDLVNRTADTVQIAEYKRIIAKLDPSIPLYNVAGNHDEGNTPSASSLTDYRKNFGADFYSFKYENLYAIILNSSLFFDPSLVPEESVKQDAWLRSTLKKWSKMKNTNIVVFEHIPWFVNQPNEEDGYFNIPSKRRKQYIDLLNKYGVKYVFAGHLHKNATGSYRNLKVVTTGPIGKPLGADSSGFRIVSVHGNEITYPYYSLDSIPTKIALIQ